jgi:hypothetical protein
VNDGVNRVKRAFGPPRCAWSPPCSSFTMGDLAAGFSTRSGAQVGLPAHAADSHRQLSLRVCEVISRSGGGAHARRSSCLRGNASLSTMLASLEAAAVYAGSHMHLEASV